jgi:hypothetical protein
VEKAIDQASLLGSAEAFSIRSRTSVTGARSSGYDRRRVVMRQRIIALTSILSGLGIMAQAS